MLNIIRRWLDIYLGHEEALLLLVLIGTLGLLIIFMGQIMAPLIISGLIAFLLESLVGRLSTKGIARLPAIVLVFVVFIAGYVSLYIFLVPLLWQQIYSVVKSFPLLISKFETLMLAFSTSYPEFASPQQIHDFTTNITHWVVQQGQSQMFSFSLFANLITLAVYVVLVPILVFFLLKDREQLLGSFLELLPNPRPIMTQVWSEMKLQFANYVRGKLLEVFVVGIATFAAFSFLGAQYAALLSVLVGLSVIIPYVGATLVTIPVVISGIFQWGIAPEFWYFLTAYAVIQALDGTVLVPVLFSEVVNLHPISIILAVLLFGAFWGFWGVFFAIPLATLVKAVVRAWPSPDQVSSV